jgi:serine/threonine protein kinase
VCVRACAKACHAAGVLHRDIRPRNCVLAAGGELMVADFGASCCGNPFPKLDPAVGALWYRSVEQLEPPIAAASSSSSSINGGGRRGSDAHVAACTSGGSALRWYGFPSDCWAVGCVMAELAIGVAPFHEHTPEAQLATIVGTVGDGSEAARTVATKGLKKLLPRFSASFKQLIGSLLRVSPAERINMATASADGWFGKLGKEVAALHPSQSVSALKLGKLSKPPLGR